MARADRPYLCFFPYLPLNRSCKFGPWLLDPLRDYQGSWLSPEFERMSRDFMTSFQGFDGQPLKNVAILSHVIHGIDGRLPNAPQRLAIQRAIEFCTLDQNAKHGDPNAGHASVTSDNAELLIWPVDTENGRVTLTRGSIVSVTSGGHRINHRSFAVPSPLEVHIPMFGVTIDEELLAALYRLFTRRLTGHDDAHRKRIITSIGWLSQAWRNTPSIRLEERIIMLKTGYEALFDSSRTWVCARRIRTLYETQLAGVDDRGARDILWSPSERPRFTRIYNNQTSQLTDIQHWFMMFGDARNSIIHQGAVPKLNYRASKSAYNGNMVLTAERLLRESIKVSLIQFGYPNLWRSQLWRAINRSLAKQNRRRAV
jgi:hypothetical protein